ncbi:MAG: hypothetical protein CMN87_10640 [Stappia sp.]|nr:hypothetical protein [Stappia sp.]MBM20457.1 hypothetical protein [Stappia sp.]|tara:strand:+ start:254 stop:451 length:198 start_codon:yes stop_codon:yes gene_type:complete
MRKKTTFRQIDVTRAAKGLRAAGVVLRRIEIDPNGRTVLHAGADPEAEELSPLDAWKRKRDARSA